MKLDQQAAAAALANTYAQQPSAASFNFDQMHSTIESIEATVVEQVPPTVKKSSRSSTKHVMTDSDAIHVASEASNGKIQANGSKAALLAAAAAAASNEGAPPSASNAPPALGNKKAKYKGLWGKVGQHGLKQAAKQKPESSSSASSGGSTRARKGGWDQLLQPVIQRQREAYHARQVQIGAASSGSGWTDANMECDCGQDSCPRCNLLLQMDGDQQW